MAIVAATNAANTPVENLLIVIPLDQVTAAPSDVKWKAGMPASQGFKVCRHIRFFGQAEANDPASAVIPRPYAARPEHRRQASLRPFCQ
ncbi:MAG: hypothetical protein Q7U92_00385 [Bradyrhizobium sp.]|uniref:hypothetical protein n=1 Tax=Bradyrhizobium sp. TaxID=376 RepID=UPI002716C256|nr:hypothetical protein [Bradyrhizobium sp.]MDO9057462.1 hypothetical protein [Bradyrhizobium sp.]MDO9562465.1 hypothetical protein [Bradyrhizobium sp.]MDP3692291.1 hypothetical protein [Bradyrhizobium sp.]